MANLRAEKWPPRMPKRSELRVAFPRGRGRRTLYMFMDPLGQRSTGHTGTRCDNCGKPIQPGKSIVIERRAAGWPNMNRMQELNRFARLARITHDDCRNPDG